MSFSFIQEDTSSVEEAKEYICDVVDTPHYKLSDVEKRCQHLEDKEEPSHKRRRIQPAYPVITEALLNSIAKGKRLSDEHMVVASQLLKQQYPNLPGLFDPKQGQNMSFPMCEDPFVQILYVYLVRNTG